MVDINFLPPEKVHYKLVLAQYQFAISFLHQQHSCFRQLIQHVSESKKFSIVLLIWMTLNEIERCLPAASNSICFCVCETKSIVLTSEARISNDIDQIVLENSAISIECLVADVPVGVMILLMILLMIHSLQKERKKVTLVCNIFWLVWAELGSRSRVSDVSNQENYSW